MTTAYLLAGQSNMAGGVIIAELPESCASWPDGIRLYGPEGSYAALDGERCGPELGFAQALAATGQTDAVLIKYAKGGTNLANEWSPDGSLRQADEPEQRQQCFPELLRAIEQARRAHPDLRFAGLAWMQGERDSTWPGMAANYGRHLSGLISAMRDQTATPELPVAIGRVTPRCLSPDGQAHRHRFRELVRAAQADWCRADPFAQLVDTDDLPQRQDALHFNTPGCLALGRRFAEVFSPARDS